MNNKLRTFKLIDREGFVACASSNDGLLEDYMSGNNTLEGYIDYQEDLVHRNNYHLTLIAAGEFKFFEEVFPEFKNSKKEVFPEENPSQNLTTQEPLSEDIGVKMRNRLKEDAKNTGGSLYVDGDDMYFQWEGSEYYIEEEGDYQKIIDSIKVLLSFRG